MGFSELNMNFCGMVSLRNLLHILYLTIFPLTLGRVTLKSELGTRDVLEANTVNIGRDKDSSTSTGVFKKQSP